MTENKKVLNLSSFLARIQEFSDLRPKATFWFGAVLSFIEDNQAKEFHDDISVAERIQIVKLLTGVLSAIAAFYEQEKPPGVYKLFNFLGQLFQLWQGEGEYLFVAAKVTYLNALTLYHLKVKQYSYAFQLFAYILDIYNRKPVDCVNEVFLAALSNYLSFLKKVGKKSASRRLQLEQLFTDLFFKFFTKFIMFEKELFSENHHQVLILLAGIFTNHSELLTRFSKDLDATITHFYQQKAKNIIKLPSNMIAFLQRQKVRKSLIFRINLSLDELLFYSSNRFKAIRKIVKEDQSIKPEQQLSKMEVMLSQTIEMLQEQKISSARYSTLQQKGGRTVQNYSTIDSGRQASLLDSIEGKRTIEDQRMKPSIKKTETLRPHLKKPVKRVNVLQARRAIKFKIFSIFIDLYEDGVLFSDYTNENKRYLEWNTISLIVQRLEGQFVLEDFLKVPLENYYDFVRILAPFLTKNDNREICLLATPIPLLQVNSLLRLYKQQGKYLKLALMNQYDNQKFVGVVDLFIQHFDQFFKQLSQNEYIARLNEYIGRRGERVEGERDGVLHVDTIKKRRETTSVELGSLLSLSSVEAVITQKQSVHKCLLLLKNNVQLLVLIQNSSKEGTIVEENRLTIKVENLDCFISEGIFPESQQINPQGKHRKIITLPLSTLTHYFPLYDLPIKQYQTIYSRMIIDCLLNFPANSQTLNLGGLVFTFVVHASKVEMIEYGKYYSVVSAELVGSRERIWALVIRFYDMAFLSYKVAVLMNPYEGFLQGVIGSPAEEQGQVMRNLLIDQSVKETVLWLKKENRLHCRSSLFWYLQQNGLIR